MTVWYRSPDFEPPVFAICVVVPEFDGSPNPMHSQLARMFLGAKEWSYAKSIEWWESTKDYTPLKTIQINDPFFWRDLAPFDEAPP